MITEKRIKENLPCGRVLAYFTLVVPVRVIAREPIGEKKRLSTVLLAENVSRRSEGVPKFPCPTFAPVVYFLRVLDDANLRSIIFHCSRNACLVYIVLLALQSRSGNPGKVWLLLQKEGKAHTI